jgi:hypothetical protein
MGSVLRSIELEVNRLVVLMVTLEGDLVSATFIAARRASSASVSCAVRIAATEARRERCRCESRWSRNGK